MPPIQTPSRARRVTDLIGRTPLVELQRLRPARPGVRVLAKLEGQNPGGSVKDRPAWGIVREALEDGRLGGGRVLLDATSGNTGIGFAMLGAALGFRVHLCVPGNVGLERQRIFAAYGAEVTYTDPLESTDGAIREARRMLAEEPERYFHADQYSNPANWRAHFETTGVEVLEQTGGAVTHFVAGLGTTGTLVGVGRRLRREGSAARLVAVQPDAAFHGIEGLKHLETAMVPAIYDPALPDEHVAVATEAAQEMTRRLAREEGLFVGVSSGAALAAALSVAGRLEEGCVVVLFPDGGARYLSQSLWEGGAAC